MIRRLADIGVHYMNNVFRHPEGEGDDGGAGDGTSTQEGGDGNSTVKGSQGDDLINLDGPALLAKLYGEDGSTSRYDPESDKQPDDILSVDDITKGLNEGVAGLKLPDDFFPADFDVSNRDHLATLFTKALRIGAASSLNLTFKPVENAMKMHAFQMSKDVKTRLQSNQDGQSEEGFLAREIPAFSGSDSALIRGLWNKSKIAAGGDKTKALAATRKSLVAIGVDPDKGSKTQNTGPDGGKLKTGKNALDAFAPMPKGQSTTQNNMRK